MEFKSSKCPVCGKDVTNSRFIYKGKRYCNLICFLRGKSLPDTPEVEKTEEKINEVVVETPKVDTTAKNVTVEKIVETKTETTNNTTEEKPAAAKKSTSSTTKKTSTGKKKTSTSNKNSEANK